MTNLTQLPRNGSLTALSLAGGFHPTEAIQKLLRTWHQPRVLILLQYPAVKRPYRTLTTAGKPHPHEQKNPLQDQFCQPGQNL